jgi:hypothetical protein
VAETGSSLINGAGQSLAQRYRTKPFSRRRHSAPHSCPTVPHQRPNPRVAAGPLTLYIPSRIGMSGLPPRLANPIGESLKRPPANSPVASPPQSLTSTGSARLSCVPVPPRGDDRNPPSICPPLGSPIKKRSMEQNNCARVPNPNRRPTTRPAAAGRPSTPGFGKANRTTRPVAAPARRTAKRWSRSSSSRLW